MLLSIQKAPARTTRWKDTFDWHYSIIIETTPEIYWEMTTLIGGQGRRVRGRNPQGWKG
jgi:hypothetical protein